MSIKCTHCDTENPDLEVKKEEGTRRGVQYYLSCESCNKRIPLSEPFLKQQRLFD